MTTSDHSSIDQSINPDLIDNGNDSDVDSLFGDISELNEIIENPSKDDDNGPSEPKESTSGPKDGNTPKTPTKKAGSSYGYGEVSGSGRWSNTAVTANQLSFPTPSKVVGNNGNTAIPSSDSSSNFTGLSVCAIPKTGLSSSVLFGPELQKALFADGEALADPELPVSSGTIQATPDGAHLISDEEIVIPTSPQHPPRTPLRLINIPLTKAPVATSLVGGPANHNAMPTLPNTPVADQLRADFWDWHRQEEQLFFDYKKAYRAWAVFTTNKDNQGKPDFAATAEQLQSPAIDAQVAWARHQQAFNKWKAANPAVAPIVNNIFSDAKAIKTAEKEKAQRDELVRDLRGKSPEKQRQELSQYDSFTSLIREAREREVWRTRVEAQATAEQMIHAQRQAVIEEQERIAAAEEERKKKEAEAEEDRKAAEARAAEKLAATLAQSVEEERVQEEPRRAAEAKRAAEDEAVMEALGFPEHVMTNCPELWNWGHGFDGASNDVGPQAHVAPVISTTESLQLPASSDVQGTQIGAGDVQDFQF